MQCTDTTCTNLADTWVEIPTFVGSRLCPVQPCRACKIVCSAGPPEERRCMGLLSGVYIRNTVF